MDPLHQWLHYLVVQLLNAFNLRRPVAPKRSVAPPRNGLSFTERECWQSLFDVESTLAQALENALNGVGLKPRARKPSAKALDSVTTTAPFPSVPLLSAHDVMTWGQECGWIL